MAAHGITLSDAVQLETSNFSVDDFRKGAAGPSDATIGTTPTVPVLLFDATTELVGVTVLMPDNWDKDVDINFDLVVALVSTQTNLDEISSTIDYVAMQLETTGGGPGKTSTTATNTTIVTTAKGLAIGDLYHISFTIDGGDATNPYSGGDDTVGFSFEWHLTNLTGVASIHLLAGHVQYEGLH